MLKIGYFNFWSTELDDHIKEAYVAPLIRAGLDVDFNLHNPFREECDLVIHSVFQSPSNIERVVGNPVFLCYSGENRLDRYMAPGGYSISFKEDSERNAYYPIWRGCYENLIKYRKPIDELSEAKFLPKNKNKFCTFIVSNENCVFRNFVFDSLNVRCRRVDSIGSKLNNQITGFVLPRNLQKSVDYHLGYKFNLCFENTKDETPDTMYITEKIMNAYMYGTVPIYWGSDHIEKFFNPKSFINCNNKSLPEIADEVKRLDKDRDAYLEMLSQPIFNEDKDWGKIVGETYVNFAIKILKENGKI